MSAPTITQEPTRTAADVKQLLTDGIRDAFIAATAKRKRAPHALGPSALGSCIKANAYRVAGTKPSDIHPPEEGRAAQLGTWEHEGLLPELAEVLGGEAEVPVMLRAAGLTIPGRLDLSIVAADGIVADLKTVGEHKLHGVRRVGVFSDHLIQVWAYALARKQAGLRVDWVAWLYLDRATGEVEVIVEPFTMASAMAVIDRAREIVVWSKTPDQAPRGGRGPGLSFMCNQCPWLRRCWGPDAVAGQIGAQASLAVDDPAREALLAAFDDAKARRAAANADYEFYRAALAGTGKGSYGLWSLRRGKPGAAIDMQAIKDRYAALGEQLPMRATSGSLLVRLTARLTKAMRAQLLEDDVPDVEPGDDATDGGGDG